MSAGHSWLNSSEP